jgi:hypothetical protein
VSNPSDLVTYWREMSKAWEEQANRNAIARAEAEQELTAARSLITGLQDEVRRLEKRRRRAA